MQESSSSNGQMSMELFTTKVTSSCLLHLMWDSSQHRITRGSETFPCVATEEMESKLLEDNKDVMLSDYQVPRSESVTTFDSQPFLPQSPIWLLTSLVAESQVEHLVFGVWQISVRIANGARCQTNGRLIEV